MKTYSQKEYKIAGIILMLCLGALSITMWMENRDNELLNNSKKSTALIQEISSGGVRGKASASINYSINNVFYETEVYGEFQELIIGDTIEIIYAVKKPSVARVINKYYMRKYKNKR